MNVLNKVTCDCYSVIIKNFQQKTTFFNSPKVSEILWGLIEVPSYTLNTLKKVEKYTSAH